MVRILTGSCMLVGGLVLAYIAFRAEWFLAIYGLVVAGLGGAILLNKKEDSIEEITDKTN